MVPSDHQPSAQFGRRARAFLYSDTASSGRSASRAASARRATASKPSVPDFAWASSGCPTASNRKSREVAERKRAGFEQRRARKLVLSRMKKQKAIVRL